jgi:hypothetical protein
MDEAPSWLHDPLDTKLADPPLLSVANVAANPALERSEAVSPPTDRGARMLRAGFPDIRIFCPGYVLSYMTTITVSQ